MGACKIVGGSKTQIMLAGLENSGKTFFLYTQLNNVINSKISTKSTDCILIYNIINNHLYSKAFNYEEIDLGSCTIGIWDLPGRENLRMFWPKFYRNIDFSGLIYMIRYDNKETLGEAIRVMHDFLSEEELKDVNVYIIINKSKVTYDEAYKAQAHDIEDLERQEDLLEDPKAIINQKQIESEIYFELLPQKNKKIAIYDIFQNLSTENIRYSVKAWISTFI
jgi:GTPase SAR1 family protein